MFHRQLTCLTGLPPGMDTLVSVELPAISSKHACMQALDNKLGTIPTDDSHAKSFHDASDKVKFKAQVGPCMRQEPMAPAS